MKRSSGMVLLTFLVTVLAVAALATSLLLSVVDAAGRGGQGGRGGHASGGSHAGGGVPPSCVPVNYGGMINKQCGATWYLPQGPQYVVVSPPY